MTVLAGPSLPIMSGKVVLTALAERDVDRVAEACQTDSAREWLETPVPYSRQDALDFVHGFAPAGWRGEHDERVWAIRESISGDLAGVIGLREGIHEVGFWLHPDAQGRGLMADAVRAVAGHSDGCLVWPELHWRCFVGNVGSMRVAKSAGFSYLGEVDGTQRGEPRRQHHAMRVHSGMPAGARPWPRLD